MSNIMRLLEIDIMQSNEINEAYDLVTKHKMPAVVVHQDLINDAIVARSIKQGRFKILTPIDWPKGEKDGMAKMQSMKVEALNTDGYEILLSFDDHKDNIKREIQQLSNFIRNELSQLSEVRFVIDVFNRDIEYIKRVVEALKDCPKPSIIRNDHNTRIQQSKANVKTHMEMIEVLQKNSHLSIKISGNVQVKTITSCQRASRFAVNLRQAQGILKDVKENPDKIKKMMSVSNEK